MAKHGANCNEFCLQMVSSMQEIKEDQSWPKHRLSKILNMILKQVSAYEYVNISKLGTGVNSVLVSGCFCTAAILIVLSDSK